MNTPQKARRWAWSVACALALLGCSKEKKQAPPSPAQAALAARMEPGKMVIPGLAYELPYRLYVPDGYDSAKKYPLVLFLHSAAPRGTDNRSHLTPDLLEWTTRAQKVKKAFVLAPQCPATDQWVNAATSAPYMNYDQSKVPQNDVGRLVMSLLSTVRERYAIDTERIYITGPSMGGSATWDYITRHPGIFAAAVPVTGVNDPSRAGLIAELPIWAFHGAKDRGSPVNNTRAMVAALKKLGSPIRYTEYADLGHNSWDQAYATDELYVWLFQQRLRRTN